MPNRVGQSGGDGKVKVDAEIRKLDQLRAAHHNQQHSTRLQLVPAVRDQERQERMVRLRLITATRDGHTDEEFSMRVGNRAFPAKVPARKDARRSILDTRRRVIVVAISRPAWCLK